MTLKLVFLALLAAHVVYSLAANRLDNPVADKKARFFHLVTQGGLFWLAIYIAAGCGTFSRQLVSPVYIGCGLVIGHLVFALSLLVTHQSVEDTRSHLFEFGPVWNFAVTSPLVLSRFLGGAVGEELIYRVAAQPIVVGLACIAVPHTGAATAVGIAVVAAIFVVVHKDFFQNSFWQGVEFVAFAVLLGVLYHQTGSFILVTVIHLVRNVEIAYLEYLAKVVELGDAELAAKEMERDYLRVRVEQT